VPTKISVIFDNPSDPEAFEARYAQDFVGRAKALPGAVSLETSKVWPKEDGTATPAYRTVDIYFPDYATASAAVTGPEAGALFGLVGELATGGFRALFCHLEERGPIAG
jgi:uncharacterized protein (TIGR02118 family)